jgi:MFS transporter, putative metabolite:H+ symporter
VIDRMPEPAASRSALRTLHGRVTWIAGLAFASNGINLGVLSFALLGLKMAWGLTPLQASAITIAFALGQLLGAIVIGHTTDWIGRRLGYAVTVGLSSVGAGAAALAPSLEWLAVLVFVAGLGFGGVAPVATSLVSEFAPDEQRGALLGWTQVLWVMGWILAAAGGVILTRTVGWRGVFALGATPIALAVIGPRLLPESPRFLIAHGRIREAQQLARDLREKFGMPLDMPDQERARRSSIFDHLRQLWSPRFRRRSALVWSVWFVMIGTFNGPGVWLPALMQAAGFAHAAEAALVVAVAVLPLTIASTLLLDRIGRKPVLVGALAVAAAGTAGIAVARTEAVFVAAGIAMSGGTLAGWPVILSYAAELYPTRMRASAVGWASAAGRFAGVLSPALLGTLMGNWTQGRGGALSVFAGALVVAVLIVLIIGEETAGRSLEDIAEFGSESIATSP